MDDIGTVLYIVFLALYIISRAFKKKGKKPVTRQPNAPQAEDEQTSQKERPVSFEDLLKEFTEQRTEAKRPKPKEQEATFEKEEFDDSRVQETFESSVREAKEFKTLDEQVDLEIKPLISDHFEAYEQEEEYTFADEIRDSFANPDDARKAIILKEVLDRRF